MKREYINNKGITLITMVVTIIVLIILAGISINLLLGENGIITKAKEAKVQQEISKITERLELKKTDIAVLEHNTGNVPMLEYIEEVQTDTKMGHEITRSRYSR